MSLFWGEGWQKRNFQHRHSVQGGWIFHISIFFPKWLGPFKTIYCHLYLLMIFITILVDRHAVRSCWENCCFRLMSESAAMSDPFSYFLSKFREIWRDNKDARCIVECHAGQAWISFHHCLPCPPPSSPPPPPHRQRRRPNPSRIRRRLRRANARAVAAQATLNCVQRVEDDGTVLSGQTDKSVQT